MLLALAVPLDSDPPRRQQQTKHQRSVASRPATSSYTQIGRSGAERNEPVLEVLVEPCSARVLHTCRTLSKVTKVTRIYYYRAGNLSFGSAVRALTRPTGSERPFSSVAALLEVSRCLFVDDCFAQDQLGRA